MPVRKPFDYGEVLAFGIGIELRTVRIEPCGGRKRFSGAGRNGSVADNPGKLFRFGGAL